MILDKELFDTRRKIEKRIARFTNIRDLYICSLSSQIRVVYKGLFLAEHVIRVLSLILKMKELTFPRFAIFHQRYSTNTFPSWALAQPFRTLAHNGEINTDNRKFKLDEKLMRQDMCFSRYSVKTVIKI